MFHFCSFRLPFCVSVWHFIYIFHELNMYIHGKVHISFVVGIFFFFNISFVYVSKYTLNDYSKRWRFKNMLHYIFNVVHQHIVAPLPRNIPGFQPQNVFLNPL